MSFDLIWDDTEFITEADLGITYRKVKADLFYENTSPHRQDLCDYEENLSENFSRLYTQLYRGDFKWMLKPAFLGTWTVIPKKIDTKGIASDPDGHCLHSDPAEQWQAVVNKKGAEKSEAQFRMICNLSIDFHI